MYVTSIIRLCCHRFISKLKAVIHRGDTDKAKKKDKTKRRRICQDSPSKKESPPPF
jgi:hypothetical protein